MDIIQIKNIILSAFLLISILAAPQEQIKAKDQPAACHFGMAVVLPWPYYDLSTLGIGNYLDWGKARNPSVPANIDYFNILYVGDKSYNPTKLGLPSLVGRNPGATWIIGNEPDSEVAYQDHISAEVYAQRYFELATIIRQKDPAAIIAFGPIIQPTPIRIFYLTKVIDQLAQLAGGLEQAHALIDVYAIHGFILNEQPLYDQNGKGINWGAGVPVGYDASSWPAPENIDINQGETYKTFDIDIFKSRVINFRQWMRDQGEQNKPLWITEFGSLFPGRGNVSLHVSDEDTAKFMVQTFDFMLGYKDPKVGYAPDANRLVQKWIWYSLNDKLTRFGGSIFDPSTRQLTVIGEKLAQYDPPPGAVDAPTPAIAILPDSLSVTPPSDSDQFGRLNYQVNLALTNQVSSDRQTGVRVDLYDESMLVGSFPTLIQRCGAISQFRTF